MRKLLLFSSFLISMGALAGESTPRFGIATPSTMEQHCATLEGDELKPGQEIYFANIDPPLWISGRVIAKRAKHCGVHEWENVTGTAYDVQLKQPNPNGFMQLWVAVVIDKGEMSIKDNLPVVLDENRPVVLRECTSREGVHLSAWREKVRLWHDYYYLGYDVEPSCSEEWPVWDE